jgi:hypothetical protein
MNEEHAETIPAAEAIDCAHHVLAIRSDFGGTSAAVRANPG